MRSARRIDAHQRHINKYRQTHHMLRIGVAARKIGVINIMASTAKAALTLSGSII